MFGNGLATCDGIRAEDEKQEADSGQRFDVTEWIFCAEDAPDEDAVLPRVFTRLMRFHTVTARFFPFPSLSAQEIYKAARRSRPDKDIPGPEISGTNAESATSILQQAV
ncbi:hypothetical protein B0H10DRAFT_2236862 [Mycena sp. CBHHK59/15]|nr:hypothetical protein B0H10DRAFT_2236862 [Mycena sp. CBHHK59/15]